MNIDLPTPNQATVDTALRAVISKHASQSHGTLPALARAEMELAIKAAFEMGYRAGAAAGYDAGHDAGYRAANIYR